MRSFRVARDARDVLIVGAGDGGRLVVREMVRNPQLRLRPVGFVDDDPRKQRTKDEHGLKVLGTTETEQLPRVLDEAEPDEVIIAIPRRPAPSAPASSPPAASAASRCARCRPCSSCSGRVGQLQVTRQLREVQVEDVLGREPVRDGARARRRLPDRRGRAGDRRRRLDRQRAVPPDRPRRPRAAWSWSTTPRTTCSRSTASSRRSVTFAPPCPCSPTARRRSACARSSPSTARRSSSTPRPTSTSR